MKIGHYRMEEGARLPSLLHRAKAELVLTKDEQERLLKMIAEQPPSDTPVLPIEIKFVEGKPPHKQDLFSQLVQQCVKSTLSK